jgi:Mrp family chromosome partitioning ATPase
MEMVPVFNWPSSVGLDRPSGHGEVLVDENESRLQMMGGAALKVAFAGKGGSGKSTLSALLARASCQARRR